MDIIKRVFSSRCAIVRLPLSHESRALSLSVLYPLRHHSPHTRALPISHLSTLVFLVATDTIKKPRALTQSLDVRLVTSGSFVVIELDPPPYRTLPRQQRYRIYLHRHRPGRRPTTPTTAPSVTYVESYSLSPSPRCSSRMSSCESLDFYRTTRTFLRTCSLNRHSVFYLPPLQIPSLLCLLCLSLPLSPSLLSSPKRIINAP